MLEPFRACAKVVVAALLPAGLILSETAARVRLGPPPPEPGVNRYVSIEPFQPFFALRVGKYEAARTASQPSSFAMPKPADVVRIFLIGGSVARGFHVPARFWSRVAPGRRVEFINAGLPGYDSARDLRIAREISRYSPDLVIVMSGNNEGFVPPLFRPFSMELNGRLRRLWIWRNAQDRLRRGRSPAAIRALVERDFEGNLRSIVRAGKAASIPVVLCTLPANLRDIGPAEPGPDRADSSFAEGWRAWESGDAAAAASAWKRYMNGHPEDPYGAYFEGRALERLGRHAGARALYRISADLSSASGMRCPPGRNETIRRVAREEGARLADLETLFENLSVKSSTEVFPLWDQCHWMPQFHPLVLDAVLSAARQDPGLAAMLGSIPRPSDAVRVPSDARRRYAEKAFLSAVGRILLSPDEGISERSIGLLSVSYRLSPLAWRRLAARGPRLMTEIQYSRGDPTGLASIIAKSPQRWSRVERHVRETDRRARAGL
jgi:hypothetical protein